MRRQLMESVSTVGLRNTFVMLLAAPVATIAAVMPATAQTVSNTAADKVLSGFSTLPASTFSQNLAVTISINNAASAARRALAYADAENLGPTITPSYYSTNTGTAELADGLGPVAAGVLSKLTYSTQSAVNTSTLFNTINQVYTFAQGDSSYAKTYFGNQHIYDAAYGYTGSSSGDPRPYLVAASQIKLYTGADAPSAPYGLPGSTYNGVTSPSYPSGHTTGGFSYALVDAIMVPERFQQSLTRGSEYGESRIVMGVHYALDVIAGRILAEQDLANMLNNKAGYTGLSVSGVAVPTDFASEFAQATTTLRQSLQTTCGTVAIGNCVNGNSGDRFANAAQNKADWTYRLTYGLSPVGATTLAPVVPDGAEVLISTRFPYLSASQRREVLYTTETVSGYPLDDGSGWARLDLYSAGDGYGALRNDTTVTMDAQQGGFNAKDAWNNDMTGSGRLIKDGTGSLTLSGTNAIGGIDVKGGTLVLTGTDIFTGASQVETGGTLAVAIDGTTAGKGAGYYAKITGTGTASFVAGGTLRPVMGSELATTSGYSAPAVGSQYTIVQTASANGVSGRFAAVTPAAATQAQLQSGTRFVVSYVPNAIVLSVAPTSFATSSTNTGGRDANQTAVGAALDRILAVTGNGATADNATSTLITSVGGLSGGKMSDGLTELSGSGLLNTTSSSLSVTQAFGQTIGDRLSQVRAGGTSVAELASAGMFDVSVGDGQGNVAVAEGEPSVAKKNYDVWTRGFGVFSNNSGDGQAPGFRSTIGLGVVGADARVSDATTVGASFGYAHSATTGKDNSGKTDGDSYQIAAYGSWTMGTVFADATASYTFNTFKTTRDVSIGGTTARATGNTDGGDAGVAVRLGNRYAVSGFNLEPTVGLSYDHIETNGFTETGAGAFNLTVARTELNSLRSGLGGRVSRVFKTESGLEWEPEVRARWEHEFGDQVATTTATLVNQSFQVGGAKPGRDAAIVGTGVAGAIDTNLKMFVSYDATLRQHQTDHTVSAGLKLSW